MRDSIKSGSKKGYKEKLNKYKFQALSQNTGGRFLFGGMICKNR
ncbi:hypothetical protein B4125_0142 [Bacillus paralicheniformis]|nr:hypothetical protein B4125_0142 [Bacillus paralicheniformis]